VNILEQNDGSIDAEINFTKISDINDLIFVINKVEKKFDDL